MQYGEIIELGQHKLMCGDATKPECVAKLFHNDHAKVLFTSPPYADIYSYHGNQNLDIKHLSKFIPVSKNYVDIMAVNLGVKRKDYEVVQFWNEYIDAAKSCGLKLLSWNVWDKTSPGSIAQQRAMFPLRHEFIFIFGEKPYPLNRTIPKVGRRNKRLVTPRRQKDGSMKYTSVNVQYNEDNKQLGTVICIPSEHGTIRRKHPAVMPVRLPVEYIKAMTNCEDIIYDCFGGSGTTLIACEMTGRKCLMMEISPDYCDIIRERYEKIRDMEPLFKGISSMEIFDFHGE